MSAPSALEILVLVLLLQLKHAAFDGPFQTRWMIDGKGRFGSLPGITHAALHAAGSLVALLLFGLPAAFAAILALADGLIHYHVDFAKEWLVQRQRWTVRDSYFWWTLAADQTLHHITYIVMAAIVVSWAS